MQSIVKVLAIITLVFVVFVAMDSLGVLRHLFAINEADIRDILGEQYPDSDPNIVFTENCTICDSFGCRTYPGPCWKIGIVTEDNGGMNLTEMLMDESGKIKDKHTGPCTEWWCNAEPCKYTYTEETGDSAITYTNKDCGSSELSCDSEHGRCRACEIGRECVATIVTTEPGLVTHRFEIFRTGEYAIIDSNENTCRIYSRGNLIFSESMDTDACGSLMLDNTMCFEGVCDFVPDFDLIPI